MGVNREAAVTAAPELLELARRLVERARSGFEFQRCTVALLDADGTTFHARTIFEERSEVPPMETTAIPAGSGIFRAWRDDEVALMFSDAEARDWTTSLVDPGLALDRPGSVLAIPLRGMDRSR